MKRYMIDGGSQNGIQSDGSKYVIQHDATITKAKVNFTRRVMEFITGEDYFKIDEDGRVVRIHISILERYFKEVESDNN